LNLSFWGILKDFQNRFEFWRLFWNFVNQFCEFFESFVDFVSQASNFKEIRNQKFKFLGNFKYSCKLNLNFRGLL
jgi:hypothetical protein